MAKVRGVQEKIHMPLYDAFPVPGQGTFAGHVTDQQVIHFFSDLQNKTRLETNLQQAGVLPGQNRFEVHAMRVVVSSPKRTTAPKAEINSYTDLIYNSVTSLVVRGRVMIEMPTFWFTGDGLQEAGSVVQQRGKLHDSNAFRFAEPVFIEPQQNFGVEMSFPRGVPDSVAKAAWRVWVVLDGYLTRDVQ